MRLYYETLDSLSYWKYFFRQDRQALLGALRQWSGTENFFLTRSGRTGIFLTLMAAGLKREDEILVPYYMSKCVLNTIIEAGGMPSYRATDRTRAVILFHQWGYPQDFAKLEPAFRNMLVIEDCANSLWGRTGRRAVGTLGDVAIFSLAKIFKMTYAGAIRVNNKDWLGAVKGMIERPASWRSVMESFLGELAYLDGAAYPPEKVRDQGHHMRIKRWHDSFLVYPSCDTVRGCLPLSADDVAGVFRKQNSRFRFLLGQSRQPSCLLPGDEVERLAPICFPVLSDDDRFLQRVDEWLRSQGIFTGIYHFDINRNMLGPCYKKCVPVPLQASLPEGVLENFAKQFKGEF